MLARKHEAAQLVELKKTTLVLKSWGQKGAQAVPSDVD